MNNYPTNPTTSRARLSLVVDAAIKSKLAEAAASQRRSLTGELEVAVLEHLRALDARHPGVVC